MNSEPINIVQSFEKTITNTDLKGITLDYLESGIDSFISDDVLKEIPVLKVIIGVVQAGVNIQDRLFVKKLLHFLHNIAEIDQEKRRKMIEKIDSSGKYRVKVGEKLIYILDSCNDHIIAEMIAKLFQAFVEEKISYSIFLKATNIIKKLDVEEINWFLYQINRRYQIEPQDVDDMIGSGLFSVVYEELKIKVSDTKTLPHRTTSSSLSHLYPHLDDKYKTKVDEGGVFIEISMVGRAIKEVLFSEEEYEKYN